MAGQMFGFKATELETEFLKQEIRETNSNATTVIRQLIQNAMEGKELDNQTEILKAELEKVKKISLLAVENATFAMYITLANYGELVKDNQRQIEKMKNKAGKLTKEEMDEIQ